MTTHSPPSFPHPKHIRALSQSLQRQVAAVGPAVYGNACWVNARLRLRHQILQGLDLLLNFKGALKSKGEQKIKGGQKD